MDADTIIVGGGLGGLAAAIRLQAAGQRVRLLEKNERVGGKLNLVQAAGYTFDTGPSLFTMPWVVRELFATVGRSADDVLDIVPVDPVCRYTWPDGTRWEHRTALPELIDEITRLSPDDAAGFFRFMAFAARIYAVTAEPFLLSPFRGWRDFVTPAFVRDAPALDPFHTLDQAVRRYFKSPYLRQVFNRYATYNGSSPYRAPATFAIIPYIEFAEGGWYLKGGMYSLARALAGLAAELGVQIETGAEVTQVCVEHGVARGVRVAGGRVLRSERVIVNVDALHGLRHLVAPEHRRRWTDRRIHHFEPSCSGFVLLLGIDRDYPELAHHNIFFSPDYPAEFKALFDLQVPVPDPTIYVAATVRSDADHAPVGGMNLFVLVNAPATSDRFGWEREAQGYRDLVVRMLEHRGLPGLSQHIRFEHRITPADFAARYHGWRGALYGPSSNQPLAAFLRPPIVSPDVRQLYFVGGATHPGGGIPLVLLSGKAVAVAIEREQGVAS
ncbi:MAG: phytoene desaturase family protein [Chloroflexota bacterium]|nr:phytoene desaturase family protein [Chloroflexota bacterium]